MWRHIQWQRHGCWEWKPPKGKTFSDSYTATFSIGHVAFPATRVLWTMVFGRIPDGMLICHHCDNPKCMRPEHLFLGTHADNSQDASQKGRLGKRAAPVRPSQRPIFRSKTIKMGYISPLVSRISAELQLGAETQTAIAKRHGISRQRVSQIAAWMLENAGLKKWWRYRQGGESNIPSEVGQ